MAAIRLTARRVAFSVWQSFLTATGDCGFTDPEHNPPGGASPSGCELPTPLGKP